MIKWKKLIWESEEELSFKDFEKKFNEYCDSLCGGDYRPEFIEFVKSNVSDEYKYTHPYWERLVDDIFDTIEFYCDLLVKYSKEYDYEAEREKEKAYSTLVQKKCQLYYDFILFRHVTNEETMPIKKLLVSNGVRKFPSGMRFLDDRAAWEKRRGYAGERTIRKMKQQLEEAGWTEGDGSSGISPDGSSAGNGDKYTSPDGRIVASMYSYYGCTSYDNIFYITFKLVETIRESWSKINWTALKKCPREKQEKVIFSDKIRKLWKNKNVIDAYLSKRGDISVCVDTFDISLPDEYVDFKYYVDCRKKGDGPTVEWVPVEGSDKNIVEAIESQIGKFPFVTDNTPECLDRIRFILDFRNFN